MPAEVIAADQEYRCPRCGQDVTERFYGPCSSCRQELAATLGTDTGGGADRIEAELFEPSMNVVPNQVATKE
jgi:DNA-directed RNA polymerase subunit RPC12/RpoP